jgi:alkylhydroperoxidase family enzyme
MGITYPSAREQGLTDELKQAIPHFRESSLFTAPEKAALRLADAMAGDHKNAGFDDIFAELKKYYTEDQIVALGWKTGMWLGYGRLVHALGVPSVGESCVIPLKRASG